MMCLAAVCKAETDKCEYDVLGGTCRARIETKMMCLAVLAGRGDR